MSGSGHGGRPLSWVAVAVIFIGFLIGGLAIPMGSWVLGGIGVGVVVLGGIIALVSDVMSDVVLDQARRN
ncbi:MAG: HGxxPAAW family protein [Streptosporangiaceae bacterium]